MRFHYSASALALVTSSALAQDCPSGFRRGTVSWYNCPVADLPTLQCATLDVPLDYAKPAGDILKLRLVRVPANAAVDRKKTVIYNPGGPGNAGIKNFIEGGNGLDLQKLTGVGYNVLSFDPRGTGLSIPFQCRSISNAPEYKNTDADLTALLGRLQQQADACADPADKATNELMGTAYVAKDIKSISLALGEDGLIRYLGYSYGTLLGSTTAAMFPESIDRMVLDGNINPTDYYRGTGAEAVADSDKAIARFFDLCAQAGPTKCAVAVDGQSGSQLLQNFDKFLSNVTSQQSYNVRSRFAGSLYGPDKFPAWAVTLKGYYNNASKIPLQKRQDVPEDEGEWQPTDSEDAELALQGVTCGDAIVRQQASLASFKSLLSLYQSTSKYSGDQSLLSTTYQCSVWENDAEEKPLMPFTGIKTRTPILFANGQYDPVTPLVSAQNSSSGFIGSRVLVSSGSGHCTSAQTSSPLDAAIMQYFDDASFPLVNQVYTPDAPNPFVATIADATQPSETGRSSNSTAIKIKREAALPAFFNNQPIILKRQSTIPVGCVAGNSTSNSTRSASTMKSGYPISNSTRTAYNFQSGYPTQAYPTAKTSGYNGYPGNNGYNTYAGSNPSAKPCPTGYKPVTQVITKTVCETITSCPYGGYCQVGQVVTKTLTRTTVTFVPTTSVSVATVKYSAASAPGQSYKVVQTTIKAYNQASASTPIYGSNAKPSSAASVYGSNAKPSSAAPVYGTNGKPSGPASVYSAAQPTYSVKTIANATRTGGYPAQFTGAASSDRAVLSFVGFLVAFAFFVFNM